MKQYETELCSMKDKRRLTCLEVATSMYSVEQKTLRLRSVGNDFDQNITVPGTVQTSELAIQKVDSLGRQDRYSLSPIPYNYSDFTDGKFS